MRRRRFGWWRLLGALVLVAAPASASAQSSGELWANITLDWLKSSRINYGLDVEPKVLVSAPPGKPGWASLDVTPSVEYIPKDWVDVIGELDAGYEKQTNDVNTTELTTRIGAHFHLFSRQRQPFFKERLPKRRLVIRDLVRAELRNYYYSNTQQWKTTVRFRNRLELLYPLNRPSLNADGALYVLSDWEWFIPVSDQNERFAPEHRIRTGLGYRLDTAWRFAAIYAWTRSSDTTQTPYTTTENIVNLQLTRVW